MASSAPDRVTRSVSATADPPTVGIANPIHADDGASGAGYAAALVAGVRTYGWVTEAVLEALGAITVERTGPGTRGSGSRRPWTVRASVGERVVLEGIVGVGTASRANGIDAPDPRAALDPSALRPTYTIDTAPVGRPPRPLGAFVSAGGARRLALDDLGQTSSRVPTGRLHPWFLTVRMAPLTRRNFTLRAHHPRAPPDPTPGSGAG